MSRMKAHAQNKYTLSECVLLVMIKISNQYNNQHGKTKADGVGQESTLSLEPRALGGLSVILDEV